MSRQTNETVATSRLRAFLDAEYESRQSSGDASDYVEEARAALDDFATIQARVGRAEAGLDDAIQIVKDFKTHLLHEYQHAHKEHLVKPKLGGSIIEWAASELIAARETIAEKEAEIARLTASRDAAWEAVRVRDSDISVSVKTRDATIAGLTAEVQAAREG